jgi:hypothetical protein
MAKAAKMVLITGNTFPVKDQIKALGGKWDADAKGWKVPADKADEARTLVSGAPVEKRGAPKDRKPAAKREILPSAPPKQRRELQAGERAIHRPSRDKHDGYEVGAVVRLLKVPGGGGSEGLVWVVVAAGKYRESQYTDDTREGEWTCWAHVRPATDAEAAPVEAQLAESKRKLEETNTAKGALYRDSVSLGVEGKLPDGAVRLGTAGKDHTFYSAPDGAIYYREYVYDMGSVLRRTSATAEDIERAKALGLLK